MSQILRKFKKVFVKKRIGQSNVNGSSVCIRRKDSATKLSYFCWLLWPEAHSLEILDNTDNHTICLGCLIMGILFLH